MKMWGGRFDKEPDTGFIDFTSSIRFDVRLYPYDIECTRVWADALFHAGVISAGEKKAIHKALGEIKDELDGDSFEFAKTDEDIHTAIERRLIELAGQDCGKVRTGRSRNDQVATGLRLFVKDHCSSLIRLLRELQRSLLNQARNTIDIPVPGHTHLQQAQPVLLAHLLLAFVYMIQRDVLRVESVQQSADSMPLGSGALAGTSLDLDRDELAKQLGFSSPCQNSVDAVSDRDFVCDMLYSLSMIMIHLSRLAEQIVLWCSSEFGLAEIDDAWATGSSLMPQKKNPDGPELIRAKTGRVTGDLVAMFTVLKGLPLAYNRDLQEDKEALFDATDTVSGSLYVMERTIATMKFNPSRAARWMQTGYLTATDLADFLVEKGLDFPGAHRVVGQVVSYCEKEGKLFSDLSPDELRQFSDLLDESVIKRLTVEASLNSRACLGGTSPREISRQIAAVESMISGLELPL